MNGLRGLAVCLWAVSFAGCSAAPADTGIEQLTADTSQGTPFTGAGDATLVAAEADATQGEAEADATQSSDTKPPPSDTTPSDPDVAPPNDATEDPDAGGIVDAGAPDATAPDDVGDDALAADVGPDAGPDIDEPLCEPGTAQCEGQSVVVCDPAGDAWGVIATCPTEMPCVDGACCSPTCEGKVCGDDGCGGSCGSCAPSWSCDEAGQCQEPPACEGDAPCDDGDPCTDNEACIDGQCLGQPLDCEDGDPCTFTGCDETGCYAKPTVCDDDDPCTDDGCNATGCFFKPLNCNDGLTCTVDACEAGACTHTLEDGACLIEEACQAAGALDPTNMCHVCDPGESATDWSPQAEVGCDDGDLCTKGDTCLLAALGAECAGTPIPTDDDNPCTEDLCVEGLVTHTPQDGLPCESDDPCTAAAFCDQDLCVAESPCECFEDAECIDGFICVDNVCAEQLCGNGVCDPDEEDTCPGDCGLCINPAWCDGSCNDPAVGEWVCPMDCCGDGHCSTAETAKCCPEDCAPDLACEAAIEVDAVPTTLTGDNSSSNAVIEVESSDCEEAALLLAFQTVGGGREDVIAFEAPYNGSFFFQLSGVFGSQLWLFSSCDEPADTCVEATAPAVGQVSTIATVDLEAGEVIYAAVDSTNHWFGSGAYTLIIEGLCQPSCGAAQCGDDGCGGSCGECGEGELCDDGACVPEPVTCANALFFSQYMSGGGKHKALEIYNHTGVEVDLSTYELWKVKDGGTWEGDDMVRELTGTLEANDVFVVCKGDSDNDIKDVCDMVSDNGFMGFNGDDALALVVDGVIVDQIGEEGPDPGGGWTVAGQNNGTKDHTLIRLASVTEGTTDWAESAANQWTVLDKNDTTGIGEHEVEAICVCPPGCNGAVCGDDGCGGSCGSCDGGQSCQGGVCEDTPCVWGYEPLHFDPCAIEASTGPLLLTPDGTYTYNTDDGTLTGPNAVDPASEVLTTLDPEVRLMIVDRLEIPPDTTLKVIGEMPLVVVSFHDIDIQGTVDVSSTLDLLGAGANPATCGSANGTGGPGTTSGNGSGAGGGGGGLGGEGGDGASPGGNGNFGGDKGLKIAPPATIRGGCAGGIGGTSGGGAGGGGGGALYLAAQHSISISGVLHAGGAGGEGGQGTGAVPRCGGGGGGSGGYLGLEAPTVTLAPNAVLAANGGGGGGGTDINPAGNGAHGPAADAPAAAGGNGIENGGSGGVGAILGSPDGGAGLPKSSTRGAGGGGGGLGFIIVNSPALVDQGATLSPLVTLTCTLGCDGAVCGENGCGESCGECDEAAYCSADGQCVVLPEAVPCEYHLDCGTQEICGWWPSHGENSCSPLCSGPVDCAVGHVCARVPGSAHVAFCRPSFGGHHAGEACEWSGDCASEICDEEHCRDACVNQAGCGEGHVCSILDTGAVLSTGCVPSEPADITGGCASCTSGHCDVFAPGNEACAALCATNSDCDDTQTCNLVAHDLGVNPETVPYHPQYPNALTDSVMGCYTAESGLGASQDGAACTSNGGCQSGTCLPIADDGYYCTRPCYQASDCSGGMVCRLTGMTVVSNYLFEVGDADTEAYTLVQLCDWP